MEQDSTEEPPHSINLSLGRMVSKFFEENEQKAIKQASDAWLPFRPKIKFIDKNVVLQYQEYPTAQQFLKAIACYAKGSEILKNYKKGSVDTSEDCKFLQPAFRNFVEGYLYETSLFEPDKVKTISALINQYMNIDPDDIMTEFLHFVVLSKELSFEEIKSQMSDYERCKLVISTGEKLTKKFKSSKSKLSELRVLRGQTYYLLGTIYTVTNQPERALYCFEKSYKKNNRNTDSLYGIAFQYMVVSPEKAVKLFNEYLQTVPKCSKKYPNALYKLARLHLEDEDLDGAFQYYEKAKQAEKDRLPFLQPITLEDKQIMDLIEQKFKKK